MGRPLPRPGLRGPGKQITRSDIILSNDQFYGSNLAALSIISSITNGSVPSSRFDPIPALASPNSTRCLFPGSWSCCQRRTSDRGPWIRSFLISEDAPPFSTGETSGGTADSRGGSARRESFPWSRPVSARWRSSGWIFGPSGLHRMVDRACCVWCKSVPIAKSTRFLFLPFHLKRRYIDGIEIFNFSGSLVQFSPY